MPAKGSVRHFAQKPQKRMQCMSDVRIEKKHLRSSSVAEIHNLFAIQTFNVSVRGDDCMG